MWGFFHHVTFTFVHVKTLLVCLRTLLTCGTIMMCSLLGNEKSLNMHA